ncbi:MAG: DUF2459 domain-containing protein [Candidatus Kapabacteria bacterium]|nr:DUF2459 domain-containing protein [Ignavibacteriota bacterium]MCW5884258.1 DUF2459 domain-containing protein [Candidatus Kapabacteria bacterium]
MKIFIAWCLVVFLQSSLILSDSDTSLKVYVVHVGLHTDFVIPKNLVTDSALKALRIFDDYQYVEIGWGDAEFYMNDGFDLMLAAKALLSLTGSVMRIEAFPKITSKIFERYKFIVELNMNYNQYHSFLKFIDSKLARNNSNQFIIAKSAKNGNVRYFRSNLNYHLFYTCNTWTAEAIKSAGYDFSIFMVLTAEQLYHKIKGLGRQIK